jgi:hypothetical protein
MRLDDLDVPVGVQRGGDFWVSRVSRLTPSDMFPARTITAWRAGGLDPGQMLRGSSPVVPITWTARACAARAANSTVAAGR